MYYSVKEVADMTGLSVRMLHHYHKIGLLKPDKVTEAGYRCYSEDNIEGLQQIMFLKELDFPLKTIKTMMAEGKGNRLDMLGQQKALMTQKMDRLRKIIATIEMTEERLMKGETMSTKERFDSFDTKALEAHKAKYAKEVKERWGKTDAYAQSKAKTAQYSKEDWARIFEDTGNLYKAMVALMDRDVADEAVQALVAQIRQSITDNFYDCTIEIFAGLGEAYSSDDRFGKHLDQYGEGFANYLSRAIGYYVRHKERP